MDLLDTPSIVVRNWESNDNAATALKKVSSTELVDVKKRLAILHQGVPKVSKALSALLSCQETLQAQVKEGSSSLEEYYRRLAEITKKCKAVEKEFTELVDVCNKVRSTFSCSSSGGGEETAMVGALKQQKMKFDDMRPGLNEMLSLMNRYRMAQLHTRKMLLNRPEEEEEFKTRSDEDLNH